MNEAETDHLQRFRELLKKIEEEIQACRAILRGEKHD